MESTIVHWGYLSIMENGDYYSLLGLYMDKPLSCILQCSQDDYKGAGCKAEADLLPLSC